MLKICDELVRGEVTREEILEINTAEVDSTTDTEASPVKRVKVAKSQLKSLLARQRGKRRLLLKLLRVEPK